LVTQLNIPFPQASTSHWWHAAGMEGLPTTMISRRAANLRMWQHATMAQSTSAGTVCTWQRAPMPPWPKPYLALSTPNPVSSLISSAGPDTCS
jgi:hypothetical protein